MQAVVFMCTVVERLGAKSPNLRETIPEGPGREDGVFLPPALMSYTSRRG